MSGFELSPPSGPVGAILLLRASDGAALLQHRDDKPGLTRAGMWVFPGGHCDAGEPCKDCALRETFEETNYRCDWLEHLVTLTDNAGKGDYELGIYWSVYDGVQKLECREGQGLEFVTREWAETLAIPKNLLAPWDLGIERMRVWLKNRM